MVVGASQSLREELKFTSGMISEFETCALTTSPTYLEECQRNFQYLQHLLFSMGVTETIWKDVIKVLSAVLHLQRLVVSGSDAATISAATKNHVAYAEAILGLEQGTLGPTLLKRAVDMHGTKTFKNLSQEDATIAIFTLSSELYLRTFAYLLKQCNSHTPIQSDLGGPILQLIDFPGSEIFPVNNLSQLLIHMTEEKMNEYLIYRSFQREVEFLRNEGVEPPPVGNIMDFEPILLLVEKPPTSIFNLLEEACLLPRGNDNALLDKILSTHSKGKLVRTGGRQSKATCFIVKHNFGDVLYDIDGFINANKSTISGDAKLLLQKVLGGKFPFLLTEQDMSHEEEEAPAPGRRKLDKALNKNLFSANLARDQLKLLIDSIQGSEVEGTADPLMIFCLRGSADIKSLTYDPSYTSPQLEFLNLSPLATFAKKGFAQRSLYKEFYDRYRVMFPYTFKDLPWKFPSKTHPNEGKVLCKNLLEECAILGCLPHLFHDETIAPVFGNTFLFSHSRLIEILELLRSQVLQKYSKATMIIQSIFRMKKLSKLYSKMLSSSLKLQTTYRCHRNHNQYKKKMKSINLIQTFYKMKLLNRKYQSMKKAILKIENAFYRKRYFFKYKKIKRGLFSLHSLVRGFVLRQQINSIIRAILKLQSFAKEFLRKNRLFYFRRIAIVMIQKVFRGSYVRYLNKPIVRALKIRRNQRIGTLAIKKLQSKFRMLRIYRRFREIINAAKVLHSWTLARKQRNIYLKILFLVKWLQSIARKVIAVNKTHNLRVTQMLQEEYEHMNEIRSREMEILNYSTNHTHAPPSVSKSPPNELLNVRIGGGYYRNAHDKFNRYVIGLDLNFDLSLAYPQGWIQTLIKFNQQLKQNGQKRLSHIAIGKNHTVLVDSTSGVYTFGLGDSGQLGHGNKLNEPFPRYMNSLLYQINNAEGGLSKSISSRVEVLSVCAGSDHTLLLTATKLVYSWGSNRRGQLGHSDFANSSLPRLVLGPKNVRVIACGSYHSACLADPGILHLWGARECLGRISDGDCSEAHTLPFFQKKRVQLVVCGDIHVTVRAGSDFYSWGLNTHGQLGIGGDENFTSSGSVQSQGKGESKVPRDENEEGENDDDEDDDSIFDELSQISHTKQSIPLKSGKNSVLPKPISRSSFSSWTEADFLECQLVAGGRHMLLVLRNRVWGWGWNKYGQLGNGKTINALSPLEVSLNGPKILNSTTRVTQKLCANASKIISVIAGWRHSAVLTKGGVVYIWGLPQLHSSCEFKLPNQPLNESETISTKDPLLVPHIVTLPSSFTSLPTSSSHLSPILGLFSCSSSAFSMTSLEIIEIDTTPENIAKKEKFQSSRKVETVQFHNSATIQKEIKQRVRQELGPWSNSALKKNAVAFTEDSDVSVVSSSSSMYNRKGWGNKSQTLLNTSSKLPPSSPSKITTPCMTKDPKTSLDRSCEGSVTEEGLLKLFSPVKKECYQSSDYNQSLDGSKININDYFNIPNDEDDDNRGNSKQEGNTNQRYRSERSNVEKGGPLHSNMSISSLQRIRRTSIAAMLHPDDPDAGDQTLVSKQSQRRASLQRVNDKISPNVSNTNPKTDSLSVNNSEKSKTRNPSQLDNEVNTLIQSAKVRKESPTRSRISQSDNTSTASSKRKKETSKGPGPKYSEDLDANDSSLSHIAVSDLATMIQSIKKESLQQLSMSWRV